MIIYKATNKVNGKSYIGQTVYSLGGRQLKHYSRVRNGSQLYFHNALRKYDREDFIWEILEYCKSQEELNEKEKMFIQEYNSYWTENGYNLSFGGDGNGGLHGEINGMYGKKHTEETLKKIRDTRKGQFAGDKNPAAKHAGRYLITFPDGHQEEITNLRKWCRENDLSHGPFYDMCNFTHITPKSYKGYLCKRLEHSLQKKKELGLE
ncbi:MAG: GIY-YIG catalytic domain protein [Candidatus Izimaplasma bacterium HR2]|nr:MAG: GIY-YIG catalytic domain protein [Candidatus Izimaplasma bacterium HR2]